MTRVLVTSVLEPFLAETPVPPDLAVERLPAEEPIPAGDYAGLLVQVGRQVGPAELDRLPGLRIVANYGVGYDHIDVAAAAQRGVAVTNTPDVLTMATAELTWALILATARRLGEGERLVRSGGWPGWEPMQLLGMALDGKVLGLIGAGRIGQEVGRRAGVFGMRVIYWGRTRRPEWERETGATWVGSVDRVLAEADVVSLHVALTPETRCLIDRRALGLMKPSAILINTARGAVVDEGALIEALETGRIRAAGLDVFAREPEVPERLRALENVVLLPHMGSATEEARWGMWRLAWENLLRGIRGEPLLTPVVAP